MWLNFVTGLGLDLSLLTGLWGVSIILVNVSIVDVYWGSGFVVLSWFYSSQLQHCAARQCLLLAMVTVWGIRLSAYLALRNIGHGEDQRYAAFRRHAGAKYWWYSFFSVFLLQGVVQWLLSGMLLVGLASGDIPLGPIDYLGALLWLCGMVFETIGDYQLFIFKKKCQPGDVLDTGLWKYTRHPHGSIFSHRHSADPRARNYFGDSVVWWGMWCVVASTGPSGILTVYAPMLMTFLLLQVSGVPILERQLSRKKPAYSEYIAKTPGFFPWFPRQNQKKRE